MKTLLTLLAAFLLSLAAQARPIYGSECGLIDEADNFILENAQSKELTTETKLSDLQGKQIINADEETVGMTAKEALAYLIDNSENGDVSYESGTFQGHAYQVVRYWPGGNPYGAVYVEGSEKPLAFIKDSDLVCAQK